MDIVRLRTMTMKSKFNDGKYAGLTVEQVFNLGKFKLQNIYYNEPKITFTDEVLTIIGIYPEQRIEKPGKNPELFDKIMLKVRKKLGDAAFFGYYQKEKRRQRQRLQRAEQREQFTKGQMQHQNVKGNWSR